MTGPYRPKGPTIRGTKKDGSARVFRGKLPPIEHVALPDYLLTVAGPAHMSVTTAAGTQLASYGELGTDRMDAIDVHMDYFDAAYEDRFGRLPHEAGYGSPLHLVPDPAPAVVVTPDRKAA